MSVSLEFAWCPLSGTQTNFIDGISQFHHVTLHTAPIAPGLETGRWFLPYSFSASPGRYLEALAAKVSGSVRENSRVFLLNPSFLPSFANLRLRLEAILREQRKVAEEAPAARVWAAKGAKIPVAYEFPAASLRDLKKSAEAFRYLSTVDAALDAKVLAGLCGSRAVVRAVALDAADAVETSPTFLAENSLPILAAQARHLLCSVRAKGRAKTLATPLLIMPFEAGDVLFFAFALKKLGIEAPAVLVLESFAPILKRILPNARVARVPSRPSDGQRKELCEREFFLRDLLPCIPQDRSFLFLRSFRSWRPPQLHLIDQFRFALGHEFQGATEAASRGSTALVGGRERATKAKRASVLCHFEGGWTLKHYPLKWRERLVRLLRQEGWKVSVLSERPLAGARRVSFMNLSGLENELGKHDLLIGMDSFPAHFANLVMGLPTLTLFGSTRVSSAHLAGPAQAVALDRGLGCNPCAATEECPRYYEKACLNYPEPESVVEEVRRLISWPAGTPEIHAYARPTLAGAWLTKCAGLAPP